MAQVGITHDWAEGGSTTFYVEAEANYPDALDQARATVMRMYRDCVLGEDEAELGD